MRAGDVGCVITASPGQPIAKGLPGRVVGLGAVSKYADHCPVSVGTNPEPARRGPEPLNLCGGWRVRGLLTRSTSDGDGGVGVEENSLRRYAGAAARSGTRQGTWVYSGRRPPVHGYDFRPNHADGPVTFLQGFKGYLQADAYAGFHDLYARGVTEVACWAHIRRYFKARIGERPRAALAAPAHPRAVRGRAASSGSQAGRAVGPSDRRDSAVSGLPGVVRLGRSRCRARWDSARVCVVELDGIGTIHGRRRLSIDNDPAERRRRRDRPQDWLFYGSDAGGERAAIILSVIETCRRTVEPFAYHGTC